MKEYNESEWTAQSPPRFHGAKRAEGFDPYTLRDSSPQPRHFLTDMPIWSSIHKTRLQQKWIFGRQDDATFPETPLETTLSRVEQIAPATTYGTP
jgi:hypothetical protein